MVVEVAKCRAVDPTTCKYHGSGRKLKILPHRKAEAQLNAIKFSLEVYSGQANVQNKLQYQLLLAQEEYDATNVGYAQLKEQLLSSAGLVNQDLRNRLMKAGLKREAVATHSSHYQFISPELRQQIWTHSDTTNSVHLDEFTVINGRSNGSTTPFYVYNSEGVLVTQGSYHSADVTTLTGLKQVADLYLRYFPKLLS